MDSSMRSSSMGSRSESRNLTCDVTTTWSELCAAAIRKRCAAATLAVAADSLRRTFPTLLIATFGNSLKSNEPATCVAWSIS